MGNKLFSQKTMPSARRVRIFTADSASPAPARGSGSDSELFDAIEDSGDIAADGAAPDDAEDEQSPVDLDSILENPAPSHGVTADGDGDEADDEEDNSEGEDELQGGESTPTSNLSNVGGGALVSEAVDQDEWADDISYTPSECSDDPESEDEDEPEWTKEEMKPSGYSININGFSV